MKIAQVVCLYPPQIGGIGVVAEKLQKTLSREHQAVVFTVKKRGEKKNKASKEVIPLKTFFKIGHGAVLFSLFWRLRKFDFIYFHYPFFGTAMIIFLFKIFHPRKKIIIHYHMDVHQQNPFLKILSWPEELIKKPLFKKAHLIISASLDYIQNSQIKKIYQKYPHKFKEVPFSINTEEFKPGEKTAENTLLFVGGLDKAHYFKGVDLLLEALSQIQENSWSLRIVGEGDLKEGLIKLSQKLGIKERISFLGKLEKSALIKEYQEAKILILPSINRNEAFGLVLIEALACATPVIASNLPGVRSVFEEGKSGLLVEPQNISDLKNKIKILLESPEKLTAMSLEARNLALEKYSLEKINSQILEIFKL